MKRKIRVILWKLRQVISASRCCACARCRTLIGSRRQTCFEIGQPGTWQERNAKSDIPGYSTGSPVPQTRRRALHLSKVCFNRRTRECSCRRPWRAARPRVLGEAAVEFETCTWSTLRGGASATRHCFSARYRKTWRASMTRRMRVKTVRATRHDSH